jgi:hypothetical protein
MPNLKVLPNNAAQLEQMISKEQYAVKKSKI